MTELKIFVDFIREREAIRIRKEAGQPAPWTTDPILAKYRFCNVRRRDDRVSRWLLEHYYPKFSDLTDDVWFAAAVARLINWPPTLQYLLEEAEVIPFKALMFDPKKFAKALEDYHQHGGGFKTYTGAYVLYAGGRNPKYKGVIKSDFIAKHMLVSLYENRTAIKEGIAKKSVRNTTGALLGCFGLSSFMAGQVSADLTYLPGQLAEAEDLYTYAPQGPGSLRGLNRLTRKLLNAAWSQENFEEVLKSLHAKISLEGVPLTLHDYQNCLCEFDKYMRAFNGKGKPRSIYKPETAY